MVAAWVKGIARFSDAATWLVAVILAAEITSFHGAIQLADSTKNEDAELLTYDGNGNNIGIIKGGKFLTLELQTDLWASGTCCAHRATPSLSQDGEQVAYVTLTSAQPRRETLSISDLRDGKQTPVFEAEAIWSVSWAPEGKRLAVVADRVSEQTRNLYIVDLASTVLNRLTSGTFTDGLDYSISNDSPPSWSPNGRRLAIEIRTATEQAVSDQGRSIGLWDLDTNEFQKLVDGRDPAWSPSGSEIAFLEPSRRACFTVKPDGSGKAVLFSLRKKPFGPATSPLFFPVVWSPDGTQLIFHQWVDADLVSEVYRLDVKSGHLKFLSRTELQVVNWRKNKQGEN